MLPQVRTTDHASPYATSRDFCRIFAEDMNGLYTLGLLLTADPEQAERSFLSAMKECQRASRVFKEWANSWARRAVMQSAVRVAQPARERVAMTVANVHRLAADLPQGRFPLAGILALPAFERFVFVMSVLEGCPDQDCAALLRCSRAELASARAHALATVMAAKGTPGADFFAAPAALAAKTA